MIILDTSKDIIEHLYTRFGIEVDHLDIAEFINYHLGDYIEDPKDYVDFLDDEEFEDE